MKHKLFSIYDSIGNTFAHPELDKNAGTYLRRVKDLFKRDPEHKICQHPQDYTVFEIGEYDDETGQIEMHQAKISLGEVITLKQMDGEQI